MKNFFLISIVVLFSCVSEQSENNDFQDTSSELKALRLNNNFANLTCRPMNGRCLGWITILCTAIRLADFIHHM